MSNEPAPATHDATPYDHVPYPGSVYAQSHPARLALIASLFGLQPPEIRRSRILELGCGDGMNILPMAEAYPDADFLGVDLSETAIERGQAIVQEAGLDNVELRQLDISEVDESFGIFDYIIAHGVYSWVPESVRSHILKVCKEQLTPRGIAYISYNCYPGWHMRGMLRQMMQYHSRGFDSDAKKIEQARALVSFLAESTPAEGTAYQALLKSEAEVMRGWADNYFRHDSLSEINDPLYFYQFAEQVADAGLQYLGESDFGSMLTTNYPAKVREALDAIGHDLIASSQYLDFLSNRMFRQSLLCQPDQILNRKVSSEQVMGMYLASTLEPVEAEAPPPRAFRPTRFRRDGSRPSEITVQDPLLDAALRELAASWPEARSFERLFEAAFARIEQAWNQPADPQAWSEPEPADSDKEADDGLAAEPSGESEDSALPDQLDREPLRKALASALLSAYGQAVVELHHEAPRFMPEARDLPKASALVRGLARQQDWVPNRRHERVRLDLASRQLLRLLDGDRDRADLVEAMTTLAQEGRLVLRQDGEVIEDEAAIRREMERRVDAGLQRFAKAALLIG